MAKKKAEPRKFPLPKDRKVPAHKIKPAQLGPFQPKRDVSGRIGYFIKELEEFRSQVEGVEDEIHVARGAGLAEKAVRHANGADHKTRMVVEEMKGLRQDLDIMEKRYGEACEILHAHELDCPDWKYDRECDTCEYAHEKLDNKDGKQTTTEANEKEENEDVSDDGEDGRPCPKCSGIGSKLGSLGALDHYRCRACGWTWPVDPGEESDAA